MEQYKAAMKHMEAEAKCDLVGAIWGSELINLLTLDREDTPDERERWNAFIRELDEAAGTRQFGTAGCRAEECAVDFGNARAERGFRIGFHIAMRLCMEGLNGGVR